MACFSGPEIVNDGLVLHLDAANSRSYPGTGTTWSDLSGNGNNGTLVNGVGYSSDNKGSLTFDGVNDYVSVTGSITTSAATFIIWIKRNGNQAEYDGILFSRSESVTGINYYSSNSLGYHWNDALNTYSWNSGLVIPDLSWCMCAVSVSSSAAVAYLCQSTEITTAINSVSHGSTTIDNINVGRDAFSARYSSGNISQALIYNRALTAAEIQQNFEATRSRYGI